MIAGTMRSHTADKYSDIFGLNFLVKAVTFTSYVNRNANSFQQFWSKQISRNANNFPLLYNAFNKGKVELVDVGIFIKRSHRKF